MWIEERKIRRNNNIQTQRIHTLRLSSVYLKTQTTHTERIKRRGNGSTNRSIVNTVNSYLNFLLMFTSNAIMCNIGNVSFYVFVHTVANWCNFSFITAIFYCITRYTAWDSNFLKAYFLRSDDKKLFFTYLIRIRQKKIRKQFFIAEI